MTRSDASFEIWFDALCLMLLDEGIDFRDADSVRADYDADKDASDVCDEVAAEYR